MDEKLAFHFLSHLKKNHKYKIFLDLKYNSEQGLQERPLIMFDSVLGQGKGNRRTRSNPL